MNKLLPIISIFFVLFSACGGELDITPIIKCPADGTNLYLKCSDGREISINIGYGKDLRILKDGKLTINEALNFCKEKPYEMNLYVKNAHFQVSTLRKSGTRVIFTWDSIREECIKQIANNLKFDAYKGIKIQSLQLWETKGSIN